MLHDSSFDVPHILGNAGCYSCMQSQKQKPMSCIKEKIKLLFNLAFHFIYF